MRSINSERLPFQRDISRMLNRKPSSDPIVSHLLKTLRSKPVFLNHLLTATDFLLWNRLSGISSLSRFTHLLAWNHA